MLYNRLLLLNLDDFDGHVQQEGVSFDANLREYAGSNGFPNQLWTPEIFHERKELAESLGWLDPHDEIAPEVTQYQFAVWSQYRFRGKAYLAAIEKYDIPEPPLENPKEVNEEGEIDAVPEEPADLETESIVTLKDLDVPEDTINENEVLEKFEKRFAKAIPMDCVNIILMLKFDTDE